MLNSLKFVQGSIAKKDFIPALTHFSIENSRVKGFNGVMALSSPIPFDIACKPKADVLIKAIANCEDTIQLALTPAGRLSVKSGAFKVYINCVQEDTPHVEPEGEVIRFDGEAFLKGIKTVEPFIGEDAHRRWSHGVLYKDQSLFATNNIILVQYWLGVDFPQIINIPRAAIKEIIRINSAPLFAQLAQNSITFHFEGDRWLRTQLYDTTWPDLGKILDVASNQTPINESLFKGLTVIKPFVDKLGTIIFNGHGITTHEDENEGSSFEIEAFSADGLYNIHMLELLAGTARTIDWSSYPAPCIFGAERLRGAIIGMKK